MSQEIVQPSLALTGLQVRGLKAIRELELPRDGMGWGDSIPEVIVIAGPNGSGKTTLLEWIVGSLALLSRDYGSERMPGCVAGCVEFRLASTETGPWTLGTWWGDMDVDKFETEYHASGKHYFVHQSAQSGRAAIGTHPQGLFDLSGDASAFAASTMPSLIYIPSRGRRLEVERDKPKKATRQKPHDQLIFVWGPWSDDTMEARLYSARWEDLNAKEEGRPQDATHFARYADAFTSFFPGKRLIWRQAELMVEIEDGGVVHGLDELSSGEKQILVFLGELLHRWRPGSMILIDEPELHLHPSLQVRFFDVLMKWRKERGGQLIVATQSNHIFGQAPTGTKLLLSEPL
jgi:predicted ATPase